MEPDTSAQFPTTWQDAAKERAKGSQGQLAEVDILMNRFEEMLRARDQELFRRIEQMSRVVPPSLAGFGYVSTADPTNTKSTTKTFDANLLYVKDQKDQVSNLGTTSAGRMSKAAVEMRVRELAEASKAAESIYNVMPEEMSRVLSPRAARAKGPSSENHDDECCCSVQQWAKRIVGTWLFEGIFIAVILGHCAVIGLQVDLLASGQHGNSAIRTLEDIQRAFALIFFVELAMRITAEGCAFFYNSANLAWNYLDALLVVVSIVEVLGEWLSGLPYANIDTISNMRVIRIVRITRLLRILRIMRLVRFVRSLRNLVSSIAMTMRSLGWSVMLLIIIIYMFGILLCDGVSDYINIEVSGDGDLGAKAELRDYFGSVHSAMHTLFRSIANGISWDLVIRPLIQAGWLWGYIFSVYIIFTTFAVLNVITAVFCQSTIEGAARDKELLAESHLLNKERYYLLVEDLFQNLRSEETDKVTLQTFERRFHDTDVRAFFHGLDLEPSDAFILFSLLDHDGSGDVDSQEFVEGLLKLKGPARAIDMAVLHRDCKTCIRQMNSTQHRLHRLEALLMTQVQYSEVQAKEATSDPLEDVVPV